MAFSFLEIISLSFLLIPGFIGLRIFLHISKLNRSYGQYENIIYGLLLGGFILSISVLTSTFLGFALPTSLNSATVVPLSALFLYQVLLSGVAGFIGGALFDKYFRKNYSKVRLPIWENVLTNTQNPKYIRVIKNNGDEIFGAVKSFGSTFNKDLLLEYPQIRERNSNEEITQKNNKEGLLYIPEDKYDRFYIDSEIDLE